MFREAGRRNNSLSPDGAGGAGGVSSPREGDVEVMGNGGRYTMRAQRSSRPYGSPLQSTKPSSSVQPAAAGDSSRASARVRLPHPEGGSGTPRMKTRVITLLLAAGLLVVAGLTALTLPASAQTQTVYVQLPSGETVPVTVDVPPGSSVDDIQLPGTPVPAPAPP